MRKIFITGLITVFLTLFMVSSAHSKDVLIGISKIVAHPALDALEKGVQDGVKKSFPNAKFDLQNANGEISTAAQIAHKFRAAKVDVAVGIATPTAQALVNTMRRRPVVFCAVTDPVGAGLVKSVKKGQKYVTGTSDMTPVRQQIEMLVRLAGIKTLGHVYTSSEANAVKLAKIAKKVCADLGIKFVESTVTNSSEVKQATQAIIGRVDGIYLSNDNTVFSALNSVLSVATRKKVPVMSADPSSAKNNPVFAAWGFDYYKMGVATGKIVARVLKGEKPRNIPTKFMTDPSDVTLIINLDVAKKIGVKIPQSILKDATVIKNGKVVK